MATVQAEVERTAGEFIGEGTQYTLTEPSNGNCNFMAFPEAATRKYAALNTPQFEATKNCGRCAEVKCIDDRCTAEAKAKSEVVYIVDQCPGCAHGDLDLSPDVFLAVTGLKSHRLKVQWRFVDCPVQGNVKYCLKNGSNEFWAAIQPTNVVAGIRSVEVNGQPTKMVDSAYYFLLDGQSSVKTDLGNLKITLTSVNGEKIEDTVSLSKGGCVEGKSQFRRGNPQVSADLAEPKATSAAPSPSPSATAAPPLSPPVSIASEAPTPTEAAPSPTPTKSLRSASAPVEFPSTPAATDAGPLPVSSESPVVQAGNVIRSASTRSDTGTPATTPALLVLLVLAGVAMLALGVIAAVVKLRQRHERKGSRGSDVSSASELPQLVVATRSYSTLSTPSQRADIALL
ncbi:hypothetical protein P43SY_006261 [Pythium insidiosum]|uniref:Expansin-like EG45 domain-containing protein n=1 Tax=Pythium insidiosum TaxID=114742 RepID=A0AAD5LF02_PYTIN|nr:hypothetical protein P43SY_006261 [Pythium insidiosum]